MVTVPLLLHRSSVYLSAKLLGVEIEEKIVIASFATKFLRRPPRKECHHQRQLADFCAIVSGWLR